jgi:multidrug transporter EmrE-like cation transporter
MKAIYGYLYIALTILLTVYGQLIIKWQVNVAGTPPEAGSERALFILKLLFVPWILSALAAAVLAGVFWLAALTRFQLSHAYPFIALTFVLVVVGGGMLFGEPITTPKIIGLAFIVAGITVASQG